MRIDPIKLKVFLLQNRTFLYVRFIIYTFIRNKKAHKARKWEGYFNNDINIEHALEMEIIKQEK